MARALGTLPSPLNVNSWKARYQWGKILYVGFLNVEETKLWISALYIARQQNVTVNVPKWASRLFLVCEIPRIFERASPLDFQTQGSFIHSK